METAQAPVDCHIDQRPVPQHIRNNMARTLLQSVIDHYKDKDNEKRFQEWVVEYRKRNEQKEGAT